MMRQCSKCDCTKIMEQAVSQVWPERTRYTCTNCGFWWTAPSPEAMGRQIQSWRNQEEGK